MENQCPPASIKEQCPLVMLNMLLTLQSSLDQDSFLDASIYFIAVACFWAQIYLGEFLPTTGKNFDITLDPTSKTDFKSRFMHFTFT